MGLTVHYSGGKAKSQGHIDMCLSVLKDVAKGLPGTHKLIDETLTGILSDWRKPKNPQNGKKVTVHWKGIMFLLDSGCEPFIISFDYNTLEFCNYFKYNNRNLDKSGFFCKTQYSKNFFATHHIICKLLEFVKNQYVSGLRVSDEGEYFGKWNKKRLENVYEEYSSIMNAFGKALDKIRVNSGTNIEEVIQKAAKEAWKDFKLKKLFK